MRLLPLAAALCLLAWSAVAAEPFLTPAQVDLLRLLPPPPVAGSVQQAAEMAELMRFQQTRTPERVAQAQRDAEETVFDMFGPTLGPRFTRAALPAASPFFERLEETEETVIDAAKKGFARPRPFLTNAELQPTLPKPRSGSYPSGHASRVGIMGIVLASMVPEQRAAIFARMDDYAESRLVGGVHYRSDIQGGRLAATAIDAVLFNDPAFRAEYAPARAEVRRALGLGD